MKRNNDSPDTKADRDSKQRSRRDFLRCASATALSFWGTSRRSVAEEPTRSPEFLLEWGRLGNAEGEFNRCVGIAIGKDDVVYAAEFHNERVQSFTPDGRFLDAFPIQPHAGGVAVDGDGNVYVAHWNSNKVAAYSPTGELLREWGCKGIADGEFQLPGSIALGPDDLIYVPDQGNSRVQKFTREGKFIGKWGSLGKEPGQFGGDQSAGSRFAGPQFVSFDQAGNVYTTDAALDRITKFTPDGSLLSFWGNETTEPGGFGPPPPNRDGSPGMGGPIGIVVDRHDQIWVSATNSFVQQFDQDGKFLRRLGGKGTQPGQFHLPHGVAFDSQGCLYVADTMNARIQKFRVE
ncbi:SMP-30/gluconolactonase/LRE family protein [bacterium]|jgi:DNA-binding beta-propeller fold protein YncE|nr:SMP-30/gluconolactonase/LRE family protein [bacterium]